MTVLSPKQLRAMRSNAAKAREAMAAKRKMMKESEAVRGDVEGIDPCSGLANFNSFMLKQGSNAYYVGQAGDHVEVYVNGHVVLDINWRE